MGNINTHVGNINRRARHMHNYMAVTHAAWADIDAVRDAARTDVFLFGGSPPLREADAPPRHRIRGGSNSSGVTMMRKSKGLPFP